MSEHIPPAAQKNTIWYGIADTAKKLGPEAWEKRVEKVIDERIIPKVSPEVQATIKKYEPTIAKAGGWLITGTEVAVVAAAAYGGIRLVARKFGKRPEISISKPIDHSPKLLNAPAKPSMSMEEASAWWAKIQKEGIHPEDDHSLDWLIELSKPHPPEPRFEIAHAFPQSPRELITVGPQDVPSWLHDLSPFDRQPHVYGARFAAIIGTNQPPAPAYVSDTPAFVDRMLQNRSVALASEKTATPINANDISKWWKQRKAVGLDTSGPRQQRAREKAHARAETAVVSSILPTPQTPSQKEIWDFQAMKMRAKQEMDMDLDQRKRLAESLERAAKVRERRAAQVAEAKDFIAGLDDQIVVNLDRFRSDEKLGIDPTLRERKPDLIAAIADRVTSLGTNESSSAHELSNLLVRISEDPTNKAYAPLVEKLQEVSQDPRSVDVLGNAAKLLEQAYNSQKGIKKIKGGYDMIHTKFTTLAAFWAQRLGLAGLGELGKE